MQLKGRRGNLHINDPIICRMEGHMIMSGTVVSVSCCLLARILIFIKSFVFPSKPHMSLQGCGYLPLPTSFALEASLHRYQNKAQMAAHSSNAMDGPSAPVTSVISQESP